MMKNFYETVFFILFVDEISDFRFRCGNIEISSCCAAQSKDDYKKYYKSARSTYKKMAVSVVNV